MRKPVAVIISDVHYNLATLPLADAAMRMAVDKANSLEVPLIVSGDLHDTKANMRGECVNAMIKTFRRSRDAHILVGNHDRINEKAEQHSLNFLVPYANVIDKEDCKILPHVGSLLLPYHSDKEKLKRRLSCVSGDVLVIMHQGLKTANSGEYIQDKSALDPEDVAGLRVISGHYHERQTIPLPEGGVWDFVGNPYTLSWAEAGYPDKGFQVLYSDGGLDFVPTNLRRHAVFEFHAQELKTIDLSGCVEPDDLVWLKIIGTREVLSMFNRTHVKGHDNVKITKHPTDTEVRVQTSNKSITQKEQLDATIDSLDTSAECKARVKELWKSLCE